MAAEQPESIPLLRMRTRVKLFQVAKLSIFLMKVSFSGDQLFGNPEQFKMNFIYLALRKRISKTVILKKPLKTFQKK